MPWAFLAIPSVAGARKVEARAELLAYGRRIRALREGRGWTQEKLAEEAGVEPAALFQVKSDGTG